MISIVLECWKQLIMCMRYIEIINNPVWRYHEIKQILDNLYNAW
jgi:hypothetical protein